MLKRVALVDFDTPLVQENGLLVEELLAYAKEFFTVEDGQLLCKKYRRGLAFRSVGSPAGFLCQNGYRYVSVHTRKLLVHRVIFLMSHGFLVKEIDHIDRNPLNNKIENLRATTRSLNMKNQRIQRNNTTGVKGVSWHKTRKEYLVRVKRDGRIVFHKWCKTLDDARRIRAKAVEEIYPNEYKD